MNRRAAILACALMAAVIGRAYLEAVEPAPATSLERLPMRIDDWVGRDAPRFDSSVLDVLRADDYINRTYATERVVAGLFVGYFRSQTFGATIHSPLNCLPGSGWEPIETVLVPFGESGSMKRVLVQKGDDRLVVLYWYQTPGRVEGDEYWSKFHLVTDAVTSRRNDAALVRVVAPVERSRQDGVPAAAETARRLAEAILPHIAALLFK